jgi:hypothetical protein
VISRLNPIRFDGGDIPSSAGVERRSQLFRADGVRACLRTIATEAQHVQGAIVLGRRRQTRRLSWSLVAVEGVEQSAVQHRFEPAPQALELERVSRRELNRDPAVVGFLSGDCKCRFSHINAENRQSQRGDEKSVLAGPAARIEHSPGESALGCQPHDSWLRLAGIPGRGPSWYDASQGRPVSRS